MVTSSSENADSISLSASTATAVAREAERSAARAAKRREEKEQKESTRPVAHVGHLPFYLEVKKGALAGAGQTSEEHNHVKKDAMEFTKHINEAGKLADKLNIDMTCIVSQTVQGQFKIVATAGNAKNDILTVLQMDQCDPLTHLLGRTQDLVRGQMTSDKFWVAKLDNVKQTYAGSRVSNTPDVLVREENISDEVWASLLKGNAYKNLITRGYVPVSKEVQLKLLNNEEPIAPYTTSQRDKRQQPLGPEGQVWKKKKQQQLRSNASSSSLSSSAAASSSSSLC